MNQREERRDAKICSIERTLKLAQELGREIDDKNFATEVSIKMSVSLRTAQEYIKIARYKLRIENGQKTSNDKIQEDLQKSNV